MAPLSESAFRSLLADCERSAFADFVAGLWRARGREGERVGDRIVADGRELRPVVDPDEQPPEGSVDSDREVVLVTATPPPEDASATVIGPGDLYRTLLDDVPREWAGDLFEAHFGRPLDDESAAEETSDGEPTDAESTETEPAGDEPANGETSDGETTDGQPAHESADEEPTGNGPVDGESPDDDHGGAAESTVSASTGPTTGASPEGTTTRGRDEGRRGFGEVTDSTGEDEDEEGRFGTLGIAVTAGVVVLVVTASLWALFLYQPDAQPTDSPFTVDDPPVDGSYRVVSQMESVSDDDAIRVESSGTYVPGDPEVVVLRRTMGDEYDGSTFVTYVRGDASYRRQTWSNASVYQERRANYDRRRSIDLVRASNSTQSVYWIENHSDLGAEDLSDGLSVTPLSILPYERAGTTTYQGRDVVRYVPGTGWVGSDSGTPEARIHSASGEILVDAETGSLLYADVDATYVPARTWGEALFESDVDLSVEYRVETDADRPEAPPWVQGLNGTAADSPATNATDAESPAPKTRAVTAVAR